MSDQNEHGPGQSVDSERKGKVHWRPRTAQRMRSLWRAVRYYAVGLYRRGDDDHIFLLAGGLAFSLLVCIVPFMLILFSAAGLVLEKPSVAQALNDYIDAAIPYPEQAQAVKDVVFERIDEFTLYKTVAGVVGFIGLFLASSGLFSSMRTILNQVFRIESSVSILVSKLRDFALVLAVLVYFLVSTAFLPSLEVLGNLSGKIPFLEETDLSVLDDLTVETAGFVAALLGFYVLYRLVPSRMPPRRVAFVSAVTTAILWQIAKLLFGFYLANAVTFQRVYGAYMFFVAGVIWIYYSSAVFIIGAEIGRLAHDRTLVHEPLSKGP